MLIPGIIKIYFYTQPVDMRKSINTLRMLISEALKLNPVDGSLFLFRGKSGNTLKALYYELNCFTLWYRRLEKGRLVFTRDAQGCSLLEEFKLEKSRVYGASSEKNIYQSDLFDETGIELVGELKDQLDETIDVESYQRKMHPVRKAIPNDLPREVIVLDIPEQEKICACGEQLVRIGKSITEQIKYIPAKMSVVQHVRPKYACKPCQENVKIAPMPSLLLPKSLATPELVAYTIIAKYCDHVPLYR